MTFEVTILGSGSATPTLTRHHTAHVLNVHEQFYLIDCGEATQYQLLRYGISPLKLRGIFISHLHGDHVYGIFGLLSTMGMMGRRRTLFLYAPAPFARMWQSHCEFFSVELPFPLEIVEPDTTRSERIYETTIMDVFTIPLSHRVPAGGYLFREKTPKLNIRKEAIRRYSLNPAQLLSLKNGYPIEMDSGRMLDPDKVTYLPYKPRSYAFCSDTLPSDEVISAVEGVTLLYHETTFLDRNRDLAELTCHTTAKEAGQIAATAGASHLLTGHYSSRYKDLDVFREEISPVFPDVTVGMDGMTVRVEKDHSITIL